MFDGGNATEGLEVTSFVAAPAAPAAIGAPAEGRGAPSNAAVSAPVQALVGAVQAVAAQVPSDLPGLQALADAAALLTQVERLRATVLGRLADVDLRQLHLLTGAASTGTWIAQQRTSIDRGEVALARRLSALPCLERAVHDGTLSIQSAERIGRALSRLRRHVDRPDGLIDGQPGEEVVTAVVVDGVRIEVCQALGGLADDDPRLDRLVGDLDDVASRPVGQLARLEAAFVLLAGHVEAAHLAPALAVLVDALLPDELERRAEDAHRHRGFGLQRKQDGSGWRITEGDLDLECGELLDTVLRAEMAVDEDNVADTEQYGQLRTEGWQAGDELPTCGGPRSKRQRRHDALRKALRRYLDSGIAGLRDKVAPHLAVTVGLDTLHGAPGARPAVAASGARLPLTMVRRWWCDSAVTRFVMGLGGKVLATSHTERTLKAHERRAKHLETGGRCQGAGCPRGPGCRLVPHHADPWATCHSTSFADTVLLCEQTHHDLHAGTTIRLKDGRWLNERGWADGPDG